MVIALCGRQPRETFSSLGYFYDHNDFHISIACARCPKRKIVICLGRYAEPFCQYAGHIDICHGMAKLAWIQAIFRRRLFEVAQHSAAIW